MKSVRFFSKHPPRAAFVMIALAAALLSIRCSGPQGTDSTGHANDDDRPQVVDPHCDDLVESLLDMLQPNHMGISSAATEAADLLNNWLDGCAEKSTPAAKETELLEQYLAPEQLELVAAERFAERDAEHYRDSFMCKRVLDAALANATADLERVVRVFHYLMRNVALREDTDRVPLSLYEIIMFGRGTAEERAWVFAGLLRQLRIDAVIVVPTGKPVGASDPEGAAAAGASEETADTQSPDNGETPAAAGASEPSVDSQSDGDGPTSSKRWLVGVLLDDGVYLFDPLLGWPIPSKADDGRTAVVMRPATLAEARQDDGLFRQLDVDPEQPYPLHSSELAQVRVQVIGTANLWADRSESLQRSLTGDASAVIYDGLADGEFGRGLIGRVIDAGANLWDPDDVGVWPYPDRRLAASDALNPNQQSKLNVMWYPFEAPWGYHIDVSSRIVMEPAPQRRQLKTRTSHVLGRFAEAIRSYVTVQLEDPPEGFPLPQEARSMVRRAAEDARFWMGACQMEQADYTSAAHTFDDYLRRYGNRGIWFDHAFGLRALCFAQDDKYAAAVFAMNQSLAQIPADAPERHSYQLLNLRWRRIRDAERNESSIQENEESQVDQNGDSADENSSSTDETDPGSP